MPQIDDRPRSEALSAQELTVESMPKILEAEPCSVPCRRGAADEGDKHAKVPCLDAGRLPPVGPASLAAQNYYAGHPPTRNGRSSNRLCVIAWGRAKSTAEHRVHHGRRRGQRSARLLRRDFVRNAASRRAGRTGTRFSHCYSMPVCHPSRIALMTGRYPFRKPAGWGSFPADVETVAHVLRRRRLRHGGGRQVAAGAAEDAARPPQAARLRRELPASAGTKGRDTTSPTSGRTADDLDRGREARRLRPGRLLRLPHRLHDPKPPEAVLRLLSRWPCATRSATTSRPCRRPPPTDTT